MIPTWGAAFGANAIFNSAEFRADLTHSAVPDKAAPGTTATFTRATTKTIENNDGYLVTLLAGEIGFPGARRVRNLITTTSEDFSNAAWAKLTAGAGSVPVLTGGFTDPNGGATAYRLQANAGGSGGADYSILRNTLSASATFLSSIWIKSNTGASQTVGVGVLAMGQTVTATTEWQRLSVAPYASASNLFDISAYPAANGSTQSIDVLIWRAQLEDVTAQTTQTAGEYVSVGVPSDWAGDELVTNGTFDTDTTGWTVGNSATFVQSSGAALLTNGAASNGYAYQAITTVVGAKYVLSGTLTLGTAAAPRLQAGTTIGGSELGTSQLTASGMFLLEFTATGATTYITAILNSTTLGVTATYDNISVKPAIYHGSFVDGVKCFPTDLSGNPIPAATMLGYLAEGARTNLILSSDDLTNGVYWSASGSGVAAPTVTVGQIDQAGTTKALKLDFPSVSVATNFSLFFTTSPVAVTASPHSNSWRLKGAVGGEQIYISGTPDGVTYLSQLVTLTDEWVDYELVGTPTAANWYWQIGVDLRDGGQSAKSAQTVYVCFPQLELGSSASSYIATTTTAQTRNRDQLAYSAAGNLDETEDYWVYAEHTPMYQDTGEAFAVSTWNYNDGVGNAGMMLRGSVGGVGDFFTGGNGAITGATTANTAANGVFRKIVGTASGAVAKVCMNGGSVATGVNSKPALPATTMYIGANAAITGFGTIRNVRIGQRQLSASELQAVTA